MKQMLRRFMRPWASLALAAALLCQAVAAQCADADVPVDDRGKALLLSNGKVPKRIVSLLPSLAETICALGECQRLVGTDRYTNWPDAVKSLPKVGGGIDPNIEAIVALRPDVVVASVKSRGLERLASLGIPVVALEPKTHADVRTVMFKLAYLLRLPDPQADAAKVWRQIDQGVSKAASSLPPSAAGTTVYFEVNRAPYAAGESSFIGETLTRLGARNVVPAALGPFPKLNPEYVVRADPDIIMVGQRNFDGMTARPGWQRMRAVKQGRICVLPDAMSDTVVRPGPRMAEGAEALADCIRRFAPALVPASAVESQQ